MAEMKARVAKNTAAYTLLRMLSYVPNIILLPIYTHFMTPAQYGVVALANAFAALLEPFIACKLSSAIPRYYFEYEGDELKTYFSTILFAVLGISVALTGVLMWVGSTLTDLIFPKADIPFFPYFAIVLVTLIVRETSMVAERLLMTQERGGALLRRYILGAPAAIAFGLWFVVLNRWGPAGALAATACTSLLMAAFALWMVRDCIGLRWRRDLLMPSLKYAIPLIPFALGGYLFLFSDRVILEKFMPLAAVGLYNIADRLATVLKDLVHAVNNALLPNYMRIASSDGPGEASRRFKRIITHSAVLFCTLFLLMAFYCEEVIILITPPSYHSAYGLIPVLLCAYLFRGLYCFSVNPLLYAKQTKYLPTITLTAGIVNVLLNLVLIPVMGTYGAAWTTVLSFALTFVIAHRFSQRFNSMAFNWQTLSGLAFPVFAGAGIVFALRGSIYPVRLTVKIVLTAAYAAYLWKWNPDNVRKSVFSLVRIMREKAESMVSKASDLR
jgi:O-antigen/teichoic acid export membrane protein